MWVRRGVASSANLVQITSDLRCWALGGDKVMKINETCVYADMTHRRENIVS
jgi:hypothetical protein